MNKALLTLFTSLIITVQCMAQIPAYTATVYDSTVSGYYFLNPAAGPYASYNLILDAKGHIVYYKFFNSLSVDFKLQPDGQMTYNVGTKFYVMDSTFFIVDTIVAANGYQTNLHELMILPDGHYLLLATENVTMDLTPYHYFLNNGSAGYPTASVRCNIIQELDENENLVFEWHLKDHISFDSVDPYWLYNPSIVDWSHSNAVVKDNDGNYLLSSRHHNQIIKVNGTTGAIMWRLGGNYNQFTFLNDTTPFYGQHAIRVLSNGNIILFDDGNHTISHGARALEYQLDENNLTAQLVWSYTYDSAMYCTAMGNVQYLPDSNRLIDYGNRNTAGNVCFNVVREDKSKVFELAFDDSLSSYRTFYFDTLPWSLNRPHIACFDSAGSHYLDAGAGYTSYLWNNGSSTRVIEITSADTFSVFVPYGQGGVISSEDFVVTDISNPCGVVSVKENNTTKGINLYPTPAIDYLTLTFPLHSKNEEIVITDISGRRVLQANSEGLQKISLNIEQLTKGMYFLTASGTILKFIKEN